MKSIKILGTGCPKCTRTTAVIKEAIKEAGSDAVVEKVEDIMEIMKYDILTTPAVVVDENVVIKGRVPAKAEIIEILTKN